jgi:hypothetical protein
MVVIFGLIVRIIAIVSRSGNCVMHSIEERVWDVQSLLSLFSPDSIKPMYTETIGTGSGNGNNNDRVLCMILRCSRVHVQATEIAMTIFIRALMMFIILTGQN